MDMILNGNRTITTNQLSGSVQHNLAISGNITEIGGARSLTKSGAGVLSLSQAPIPTAELQTLLQYLVGA
jgi:hypothetical protein